MKRVLAVVATVAAFSMVVGTAFAQESDRSTDAAPDRRPHHGALWAAGNGTAVLDVTEGWVGMRVDGDVSITGGVTVLRITGDDDARTAEGDAVDVSLDDFQGTIVVRGTDFIVEIDGKVALHGRGSGQASFEGRGWWHTLRKWGRWAGPDPIGIG